MSTFAPAHWIKSRRNPLLQVAVHAAALVPLALLVWDGLHGALTANPIQAITARTGWSTWPPR
jgi:DMSO/TMAO reductase YedYZ heme-binding membrane subunit